MADSFSLTNRFKISIPAGGDTNWLTDLTHWAEMMEVMFTALANKDYVITGLTATFGSDSLGFTYSAGSVSINGETVDLNSGNATAEANAFNWLDVQEGVVKLSTLPPSGANYVPLYSFQTDDTGIIGGGDLRTSPPSVNGVSIAPRQVNPTSNINMDAGKRVLHADQNVASNIVMFTNAQTQEIVTWGNQTAAIGWGGIDVSTIVTAEAKFAILNCYIATYTADTDGFAVLEVKTKTTDTDNVYNFVDYGHPTANVLNASQRGPVNQITLPLDIDEDEGTKKFQVRSLVNNLGATGVYYASVKIIGYVV